MGEGDYTVITRAMLELDMRQMTQLKCIYTNAHSIYTNAHSMGSKQQELEVIVQQANYHLVAITETWWDHSYNWRVAMDGYQTFRRNRQERRSDGVALYLEMF